MAPALTKTFFLIFTWVSSFFVLTCEKGGHFWSWAKFNSLVITCNVPSWDLTLCYLSCCFPLSLTRQLQMLTIELQVKFHSCWIGLPISIATVLFLSAIIHREDKHAKFFVSFCHICRTTVCWDPKILLPRRRDVTTSSLHLIRSI